MISTARLNIEAASDDEMRLLIEKQTSEEMKAAYGEMLAGCLATRNSVSGMRCGSCV